MVKSASHGLPSLLPHSCSAKIIESLVIESLDIALSNFYVFVFNFLTCNSGNVVARYRCIVSTRRALELRATADLRFLDLRGYYM